MTMLAYECKFPLIITGVRSLVMPYFAMLCRMMSPLAVAVYGKVYGRPWLTR
nr:MAG TPA: hypothetical protein [Caudoviricetes sp.]